MTKKTWFKKYAGLIITIILFFFIPGLFLSPVMAVKFSLIAPSGQLSRGQTVRFTINIDTQGANIKTAQVGMTYETQYIEYVSHTAGNAMTTVSVNDLGGGKLLFSGENNNGFSGQGVFAYVDFKIIAQAPGTTQLCVLWVPTPSPSTTPLPTTPSQSTPIPTSPPPPTQLPTSGFIGKTLNNFLTGLGFLGCFFILHFLNKKTVLRKPKKNEK